MALPIFWGGNASCYEDADLKYDSSFRVFQTHGKPVVRLQASARFDARPNPAHAPIHRPSDNQRQAKQLRCLTLQPMNTLCLMRIILVDGPVYARDSTPELWEQTPPDKLLRPITTDRRLAQTDRLRIAVRFGHVATNGPPLWLWVLELLLWRVDDYCAGRAEVLWGLRGLKEGRDMFARPCSPCCAESPFESELKVLA